MQVRVARVAVVLGVAAQQAAAEQPGHDRLERRLEPRAQLIELGEHRGRGPPGGRTPRRSAPSARRAARTSSARASAAKRSRGSAASIAPQTVPEDTRDGAAAIGRACCGTFAAMFPGAYLDTHPDKPAFVMGAIGVQPDLRRAGRRGEPGEPRAAQRRRAAGRPRRGLHGEPPAVLRGDLGLPLRRCGVHRVLQPADQPGAGVHPRRLPGQGVHHLHLQGRPGRGDRRRQPRRRAAADARRHDRRLRRYEAAVAAQPATPLDGERIAGTDMLYSSGTTGMPKGITRPFEAAPLATSPAGVAGLLGMLFSLTDDSVYLSPAPFYHAAPLRFMLGAMGLGATVVGMEHFDSEDVPGTRRAPPRDPHAGRADDVRAHAQAARGGARPVRRVVVARWSSTPPRRARSR